MSSTPISSTSTTSSTSSVQGGVSSLGLGSGLDLNGIISKLISVEKLPIKLLTQQQTDAQTKISTLSTVQNDLTTLQTSLFALKNAGSSALFTATSSNSANVSASATTSATAATYTVNVTTLAQAQSIATAGQASTSASIGSGAVTTMTINFGTIGGGSLAGGIYSGSTFTTNTNQPSISLSIDSSNNTLTGIRDAINNSAANGGRVTASIVNDGTGTPYRLSLTSSSGATNSLSIGVVGDATLNSLLAYDPAGTQNMTEQQTGVSANFSLNGLAITSDTNTITTAATGVTFNLLTAGSTATITIAKDNSDVTSAINDFVTAYNTVATEIKTDTAYQAVLQGDSGLRILSTQLTAAVYALQSHGSTGYNSLSDLGVTFKQDGTLTVNSDTLSTALTANSTQIKSLVGAYGSSLGNVVFSALGTSGLVSGEISSLNTQSSNIDKQIAEINTRVSADEANMRTQFAALDSLIASLQRTSTYLTQQFKSISSNSSSNSNG